MRRFVLLFLLTGLLCCGFTTAPQVESLPALRIEVSKQTMTLRVLDDKGKELLEQYENAIGNWECLEIEDAFIKGFCLGAKLTAESLISK